MRKKLSKLQKIVVVCIGVITKQNNERYMKRKQVTEVLIEHLQRTDESFPVVLSASIKSLRKQELLTKRAGNIGLTDEGKEKGREIINELKQQYEKVDWDTLKEFYGEYHGRAKKCYKEIL